MKTNEVCNTYPGTLANVGEIRALDFPLFDTYDRIYLDSSATTQEPQSVKKSMYNYRTQTIRGSNHSKNSMEAREANQRFEESRHKLELFFNAKNYVVAFTGGTTDSSNWTALRFPLEKGDMLILTSIEHNSQIVTARNMAQKMGAEIEYIPDNTANGQIDLKKLQSVVANHKKGKILLNLVHSSNVTGIMNPVHEIRQIMGNRGFIYLDMAQTAGHCPIDLDSLDVDFAGISSHKMYGPMGIGAIFINKKSIRHIPNTISGGSAVKLVSHWFTAYNDGVTRLEPGTQDIEGAIEWGLTIDYLQKIGMANIAAHDSALGKLFISELMTIPKIKILGPTDMKLRSSIVTFTGKAFGTDHEHLARELDKKGISVRDGCFCAHIYVSKQLGAPDLVHEIRTSMMKLGIFNDVLMLPGAVRASFAFYNNVDEVYKTAEAIRNIMSTY
ncbi:MAG: aminotransferase class V-fold PLP-dependent enzyme [Paludibacter sp.]|nr:aminotransferase class V-fold PLP-dependent enzyme [Paludibacter sp.]